jgi:stringent starvation protein B
MEAIDLRSTDRFDLVEGASKLISVPMRNGLTLYEGGDGIDIEPDRSAPELGRLDQGRARASEGVEDGQAIEVDGTGVAV